jgi:hypothetical protein
MDNQMQAPDVEGMRDVYGHARRLSQSASPVVADAAALIAAMAYNVLRQIDTSEAMPGPEDLYAARA